ncbi:hypothetical protein AB0C18_21845 [Nonomuraea muscovyensis]|uniref:hypothetical protein n=1 Tax=Nonomuraea muscovyensis TaxID=1124761 RepID=UPI0033C6C611
MFGDGPVEDLDDQHDAGADVLHGEGIAQRFHIVVEQDRHARDVLAQRLVQVLVGGLDEVAHGVADRQQ